jgi:hypothetical protein
MPGFQVNTDELAAGRGHHDMVAGAIGGSAGVLRAAAAAIADGAGHSGAAAAGADFGAAWEADVTRPGESVEGITVPLGNPDALLAAGKQLQGAASQLEASSAQIAGMPSLMSSWSGPGSSTFASLTGHEAVSVQAASRSVLMSGISVQISADQLQDAQRKAQRAIVRAKRAREEINEAKEAIREAVEAQGDARGRMAVAAAAREAAEFQMFASAVDALVGNGAAAAAAAADAEYRAAERDLHEAERREARARDRLTEAEEDLRAARKEGQEAADDAETAGLSLQGALAMVPPGVLGMPGVPARGQITDAAGIPRPQPQDIPISEREPPENWPGFAKSLFKLGRGEATALAGAVGLAKSAYHNPEKIPGALADVGSHAYHDPLGTGKNLIGYDELANGRYEDWLGQMGIGILTGGAGTVPSRASRLNRVVGSPRVQKLGTNQPLWGPAFAGKRLDFSKPDLGTRPGSGAHVTIPSNREWLARTYPNGVRYTRAGYPVFTPYAKERVVVENLTGDMKHDNKLANAAAGINGSEPPDGYTWHHVEDGRTMELVPSKLHEAAKHTGGRAAMPDQLKHVAPGGAFTPGEQLLGGFGAAGGAAAGGPATAP